VTLDPEQVVDKINKAFGSHERSRALHAKGTLLRGTFTATPEAKTLTKAAHMQGDPVQVTFRFSNGSGHPRSRDNSPDPRGMAVKMYLPDGSRTDIVAVTSPLFPTRTPEGFVDLIEAQSAGPAAALKMPLFFARHREALLNFPKLAPTLRPPTSYAGVTYHGIHAFKWIDADGGERYVRYRLLPEHKVQLLAPWQARRRDRDFLQKEIRERLEQGPFRFGLEVQIAAPGDRINDPSAAWPKDRQRVQAGTFEVTEPETEREQGDDVLVFDPVRLTDGIELSDDPVLRFRPKAYDASVKRRVAG
jgi:catalase